MRRGDIKVFAFIAPSLDDGCLPVMCESRNFESIFRPFAILYPRWCPRPQLHVSPSRRLRHVTKPTVTYMTDFWFCLRCHSSILEIYLLHSKYSVCVSMAVSEGLRRNEQVLRLVCRQGAAQLSPRHSVLQLKQVTATTRFWPGFIGMAAQVTFRCRMPPTSQILRTTFEHSCLLAGLISKHAHAA